MHLLGSSMGLFIVLLVLSISHVLISTCYGDSRSLYNFASNPTLKPYRWFYLRVALPPRFVSLTITLDTDIYLDPKSIHKIGAHKLPIVCFREGGPPLPDVSNSADALQNLVQVYNEQSKKLFGKESCFFMQGNMTFTATNEQVREGVLYAGIFYGIGPARTQSKMINRGKQLQFNTLTTTQVCNETLLWGPNCNNTLEKLQCSMVNDNHTSKGSRFGCKDFVESCHETDMSPRLFYVNLVNLSNYLTVTAKDIRFDKQTISSNTTSKGDRISLMCYARNGAIPTQELFDYSTDLSKNTLSVESPKLGNWYFYIVPSVQYGTSSAKAQVRQVCHTLGLKVTGCTEGKAGPNCSWQRYNIEENNGSRFIRDSGYEQPSIHFPVSNIDSPWTYFVMRVGPDTANRNIRIELEGNTTVDSELYARLNGLPSRDKWDYYYANQSSNSNNGSSMFKLYESSSEKISFVIVSAQEGNWSFGLRIRPSTSNSSQSLIYESISLETCPDTCLNQRSCSNVNFNNGLGYGSFCQCDRFHGGFDCSIEIVSKREQKFWTMLLVGSNAASILPAMCALWKKSYAEWIVFLSSGIASAVYHACDTQWHCILNYDTLQFMDFWLSFVAVISTFVYMALKSEAIKRAILSVVWILTALMAFGDDRATSSKNFTLVVVIGVVFSLVACLVELSTKYKSYVTAFHWPVDVKSWFLKLLMKLYRRFHWMFIVAGLIAVTLSLISWNLEEIETYWFWHSMWHISIYIAAALFVCSKANNADTSTSNTISDDHLQLVTNGSANAIA